MKIKINPAKDLPFLEQLERFEIQENISFPKEYKNFLLNFGGGEPESNIFNVEIKNDSGVNQFLGLKELTDALAVYKGRIPKELLPIAYAEGGNLICIGMTGGNEGKVFFWDHEGEGLDEEKEPTHRNIALVSDTLNGFFDRMEPFDIKNVKLQPGQVKSAWIDPSLLK